ncbi:MAG: type II toxin-antitoxin system RelE/ParE family toxin [Desulfobacteria bacterium]|jgi:proteic killer suppression protein
MIKSFKHKGIEKLFHQGTRKHINPKHAPKLVRILDRLDASMGSQDMDLPGYKLHQLSGKAKGTWSVWVTGNWRVTFRFDGPDVVAVDYIDYH